MSRRTRSAGCVDRKPGDASGLGADAPSPLDIKYRRSIVRTMELFQNLISLSLPVIVVVFWVAVIGAVVTAIVKKIKNKK